MAAKKKNTKNVQAKKSNVKKNTTSKSNKSKTPKRRSKKKKSNLLEKIKKPILLIIFILLAGYVIIDFFELGKGQKVVEEVKEEIIKTKDRVIEKVIKEDKKPQEKEADANKEEKKLEEKQKISKEITPEIKEEPVQVNLSKEEIFNQAISKFARKYEGLSLKMGADPEKDAATDNSHLIVSIYNKAAEKAGYQKISYKPMEQILKEAEEISLADLANGDIIALKNGMIGMIYGCENPDSFYLVYASAKYGKVVSLESTEFSRYWLNFDNKEGYYRIKKQVKF